ncbi:MAG: DNA adenine methylase, partial [Metamycoplasmataceae bacterium]
DNYNYISPFVKWLGGKRFNIKKHLVNYLPSNFDRYIEPFLGGGAMFCFLLPKKAILNDVNSELILSYEVIKENHIKLIKQINKLAKDHNKEKYYKVRESNPKTKINKAARFIYLNKTCFNGIYRVNKNNKFNVPFNKKINPKIYDEENIEAWNKILQNNEIELRNQDFLEILEESRKGDFVFCDPPYDYQNNSNGFDSYTKNNFGKEGQTKLADALKKLNEKGIKWMHTNHNTDFINELYKDFKIIEITTNRLVNVKSEKRINTGKEVVIINYEL